MFYWFWVGSVKMMNAGWIGYTGGMEVLLATTNPAKILTYKGELEERGFRVLTLADLDLAIEVEETGADVLENARLKALGYYREVKLPTVAMDNGLLIRGVDGSEQPGVEVRRVAGKRLDDEAMIRHYARVIARYGGRLMAKWQFGVAVCVQDNVAQYAWEREGFELVAQPCAARRSGYPLDSLSVSDTGEYAAERPLGKGASGERSKETKEVVDFVERVLRRQEWT